MVGLSLSGVMPLRDSILTASGRVSRHVTRGVAFILLCSIAIPGKALAESVNFQGRAFEVDKLELLPGDQATVRVQGQTFLTSAQTVGKKVFRIYAEKPELLPTQSIDFAYGSFVASLALHGAQDDALAAIQGMLVAQGISEQAQLAFFPGVASQEGGGDLLLTSLRRMGVQRDERPAACIALPSLSARNITEARQLLSSDLRWVARECPRRLVHVAQRALLRGDRDQGALILSCIGSLFGGDSEIAQAAATSSDRLQVVREAVTSGDAEQFESALRGASFDPLIREYYENYQGEFVAEFSERALSKEQSAAALRGLSLLDFAYRTDRHHELTLRAIRSLRFNDSTVLAKDSVRKMLWAYAAKDQSIKDEYIELLRSRVLQALQAQDPTQGALYFDLLQEVRADPSFDNDELRGLLAEGFVDRGDVQAAETMLHGVRTAIPWIVRFRLLLKLDRYVLLMIFLGGVVVARWMFKALLASNSRQNPSTENNRREEPESTTGSKKSGSGKKFKEVDSSLKQSTYKGLDEYRDLLAKFYLKPDASLADIKNAYRATVKALHPDINPNATKEETSRFIELTKTYERIIVLFEERAKRDGDSPEDLK